MNKLFHSFSILFLLMILFTGCTTSPGIIYPEFSKQKKFIRSITILSEVTILDATRGANVIDVMKNKNVGKMINEMLAERLTCKGYPVDKAILSSIGLVLDPNTSYKLSNPDNLPNGHPPFYVNEMFNHNGENVRDLSYFFEAVNKYQTKFIKEITLLKTQIPGDALLVCIFMGREVPLGLSIREALKTGLASAAITGGHMAIATASMSAGSLRIFVIKKENGEIIWFDNLYLSGGNNFRKSIKKLIIDAVNKFP